MELSEYRRKRNFARTPEPDGRRETPPGQPSHARTYVIQKHAARRLHYDLRLEHGGVLKSWAVPKGPSLDPKERRLAVQVEDHPLEYGAFEGHIPEGEYGAGRVLVWDRGYWIPESDPAEGLQRGKLSFHLKGDKLQGGWSLVRLRGRALEQKPSWLLIKSDDAAAAPESVRSILDERPESVATGRRIEELDRDETRVWSSNRTDRSTLRQSEASSLSASDRSASALSASVAAIPGGTKRPLPDSMPFQLATLTDQPPSGDDWLHEIKLDGFRLQCRVARGRARLVTRTGQDWTDRFPGMAEIVGRLPVRAAMLDGELVALQPDGRSSFHRLQQALSGGQAVPLVYYAFDLLHLDGVDLRAVALEQRKGLLNALLGAAPGERPLRYCEHIIGSGEAFYREVCQLGLEGMIAKRRMAPYRGGRGRDWLKIKCLARQEFLIGGYTEPAGSRTDLGALLLGVYEQGRLIYAGRVGTGFGERSRKDLRTRLEPLAQSQPPFHGRVPGPLRGIHWVRPELVAEIAFTEWTPDGLLRHPSFQGLRGDKRPAEVRRERPEPIERSMKTKSRGERRPGQTEIAGIRLTNPSKILYPGQGLTKQDLAAYYETIADWILPHIVKRPLTIVRCPEGHEHPCFFQRHTTDRVPEGVRSVDIVEEHGKKAPYLMIENLSGLIALVQMGVLEIHVWGSRSERLEYPDRMVFDLDPGEGVSWTTISDTAELLKRRLAALDLDSWVKTTGGSGVHVVVPLAGRLRWEGVKAFARAVAEHLVRDAPDRYTSKMSKTGRKGKIFIDYLRNSRGATAVAPYSTRARTGATVATPVAWEELRRIVPDQLRVDTVPSRLEALRRDPWHDLPASRQALSLRARKAMGSR